MQEKADLVRGDVRAPLVDAVRRIADEISGPAADGVDREARFPAETLAALRAAGMLSACVPEELGGLGASVRELAAMCLALAQRCSSSGMVFAMHHIQLACIVRHGWSSAFFREHLREVARQQILIASVTSEVGVGGDMRRSLAGIEGTGAVRRLDKNAPTTSYGAEADELLVTCRRSADAPPSDQALVLLRQRDYRLEQTGTWDTLGMRGTCSPGFKLTSSFPEAQILPAPFADIAAQTMVPISHVLWGSVWLGIATEAVARARAFVRAEARKTPGTVPPGALRVAELSAELQTLRSHVQDLAREYEALLGDPAGVETLSSVGFALKINNLKIAASQAVLQITNHALNVIGVAGYKNDSKFSVGRLIRDAHSAALMIANDRIYATNAALLLVHKEA